jgi:hypothetical protein
MNTIDVGQAIQIVANIGVVASIVLLAFQLKQNNKLMAATAAGVSVAQTTSIWSTVIEQPEMAELLIKDRQNEAFTPAQEMRLNAYWIRSLFHTQYVFHETHRGEWLGKGWQTAFRSYGSLRRAWSGSGTGIVMAHKDLFSPEFIKFMEANLFKEPTEGPLR